MAAASGEGFSNFAWQRYNVTFASSRASIQDPRDALIPNGKTSPHLAIFNRKHEDVFSFEIKTSLGF